MSRTPPLWKASVTVKKDRSADIAALFELAPPTPQRGADRRRSVRAERDRRSALSRAAGRGPAEHAGRAKPSASSRCPIRTGYARASKACRRCAPDASSSMARMMRAGCRLASFLSASRRGWPSAPAITRRPRCASKRSALDAAAATHAHPGSRLRHRRARHRRREAVAAARAGLRHRSRRGRKWRGTTPASTALAPLVQPRWPTGSTIPRSARTRPTI